MQTHTIQAAPAGSGKTHAKVIVLGEHSVVYGKPAIAFPVLSLELEAKVTVSGEGHRVITPFHSLDRETAQTVELERKLSEIALSNTLEFLEEAPNGIEVRVSGLIPPARGLGSSAAVAGAIAQAVSRAYGRELSRDERFELVQSVERVAHGTPSGLDAYATTEAGPIWFEKGEAKPLRVLSEPRLLVADTGIVGHTAEAVRRVRALRDENPPRVEALLAEAAQLAQDAGTDLAEGNHERLGAKMDRNHEILRELGVSADPLESLVNASKDAGALGAKLTGGGLGGCMVALVGSERDEHTVSNALLSAGAKNVWPVHKEQA
ncbi:mevalonate kinase [Leucobacter chinensis]|uniref:mevalonate kinase n=1 Tax=Leucobacter chinensis TaxID=2851010 RepID=UPI001C22C644|nr:mevalonate kinase [Leucobacter chinensis]